MDVLFSIIEDITEMKTRQVSHRDSIGRRQRFQRMPVGKKLIHSARDDEILRWLYRYRYLRASHLQQILKPKSPKRFVERLGDLYHETGFLNRPNFGAVQFDARCTSLLYEISESGIRYIDALGTLPHRAVTISRRAPRGYSHQYLHSMMIIETLLSIELETILHMDQRFVPVDEILARAPAKTQNAKNPLSVPVTLQPSAQYPFIRARQETFIIPDGLYGIEYLIDGKKRYRFWALECERTNPFSRTNTKAASQNLKRAAYDALLSSNRYKEHWNIPNLKLNLVSAKAFQKTNPFQKDKSGTM